MKKGQRLGFEAEGEWRSGISHSGPDGDDKYRCNDFILCDNLGVLVGSIGEPNTDRNAVNNINIAFKIGSATLHDIQIDGTLFLSMNDNIEGCEKGTPDGCFWDNRFFMKVTITVRQ